jgi:D-alanyl-D-alanine carboxypeptidase
MTSADYRIESDLPLISRLVPSAVASKFTFTDWTMAVAVAAKGFVSASGQEIRVVHVPSGEVLYRKAADSHAKADAGTDA